MFSNDLDFGLELFEILPHRDFRHIEGLREDADPRAAFLAKPFQYPAAARLTKQSAAPTFVRRRHIGSIKQKKSKVDYLRKSRI